MKMLVCDEIVQAAWLVGHIPEKWPQHRGKYQKRLEEALKAVREAQADMSSPFGVFIRRIGDPSPDWLKRLEETLKEMAEGKIVGAERSRIVENIFRQLSRIASTQPSSDQKESAQ